MKETKFEINRIMRDLKRTKKLGEQIFPKIDIYFNWGFFTTLIFLSLPKTSVPIRDSSVWLEIKFCLLLISLIHSGLVFVLLSAETPFIFRSFKFLSEKFLIPWRVRLRKEGRRIHYEGVTSDVTCWEMFQLCSQAAAISIILLRRQNNSCYESCIFYILLIWTFLFGIYYLLLRW